MSVFLFIDKHLKYNYKELWCHIFILKNHNCIFSRKVKRNALDKNLQQLPIKSHITVYLGF